jgi:hypothetical protein
MTPDNREVDPAVVGLDPWGLKRIEKLLLLLDGVGSIKIVPDGHGGIEEIHVLSDAAHLGAKQIVRNIESALLAEFGLQIDHRKISVARLREPMIKAAREALTPDAAPADLHVAQATAEPARDVLDSFRIERTAGTQVACTVHLTRGDEQFDGEAEGPDFEKSRLEVAAKACLAALLKAGQDDFSLALHGAMKVEGTGRSLVVVAVVGSHGRRRESLAGVAEVRNSPEEAAVLACLHATNRWMARSS